MSTPDFPLANRIVDEPPVETFNVAFRFGVTISGVLTLTTDVSLELFVGVAFGVTLTAEGSFVVFGVVIRSVKAGFVFFNFETKSSFLNRISESPVASVFGNTTCAVFRPFLGWTFSTT